MLSHAAVSRTLILPLVCAITAVSFCSWVWLLHPDAFCAADFLPMRSSGPELRQLSRVSLPTCAELLCGDVQQALPGVSWIVHCTRVLACVE